MAGFVLPVPSGFSALAVGQSCRPPRGSLVERGRFIMQARRPASRRGLDLAGLAVGILMEQAAQDRRRETGGARWKPSALKLTSCGQSPIVLR